MLCLQFPTPRPILNTTFSSSHHRNKSHSNLFTNCTHVQSKIRDEIIYDFADYSCKPIISSVSKFRLAAGGSSKCDAAAAGMDEEEKDDEIELTMSGVEPELMPKHVAVIMDGNRRRARNRGLPVELGHKAGGQTLKKLAINCMKYGVKIVSVFAFSTENWVRPQEEVDFLMNLFEEIIISDTEELMGYDVRVTFLGNRSRLPQSLRKLIFATEERAKDNKGVHLVIAMDYSGRYDITEATKKIATKVKDGLLQVDDINHTVFEQHLETNGIEFPQPDLLIRTSGELRVSNYMLWQSAYTEMFFSDKLFPDFEEADLVRGLAAFQRRQRRFGGHKY